MPSRERWEQYTDRPAPIRPLLRPRRYRSGADGKPRNQRSGIGEPGRNFRNVPDRLKRVSKDNAKSDLDRVLEATECNRDFTIQQSRRTYLADTSGSGKMPNYPQYSARFGEPWEARSLKLAGNLKDRRR